MKAIHVLKVLIGVTILIAPLSGCTKNEFPSNINNLLKEVKFDGSTIEKFTYTENNLVSEVNSTYFGIKYYYNKANQLVREEIAVDPDIYSSTMPIKPYDELVDPEKVGISMYNLYSYDNNGRLIRTLHYVPGKSKVELRSSRTFEYNDKNLIIKELLYNSSNEVTHLRTYNYDSNGNVIEEDYYSYLFILEQSNSKHISKTTYEYDAYFNPYKILEQTGHPGIYTNLNNIIKSETVNYDPSPGIDSISIFETAFEYNSITGYPLKSDKGKEYVYK